MLQLEQRDDICPVCPHCEEELAGIYMTEIQSVLGRRYVYFCPNCRKVLGVAQRKGYLAGG